MATDSASDAPDWLGVCRRSAAAIRAMLADRPTIAERVRETGTTGEGGDQTLLIDEAADLIDRVRAEENARAALDEAVRVKDNFLSMLSHELRTPLNSSLILAKLLADNPTDNLTEEQIKYAQTIQSSGNDLLNLINDILDLSKIEAGHVEIRPEVTTVERLATNLRQLFQPVASEKS